jgi:flagellar hook-associated protein 2
MNWQTTVQELATAERAPETQWKTHQTSLNAQNSAFTTIAGDLATLQTDLETLQDPTLYEGASAQSSDSSIATASAASGATPSSYNFNISQLATAAQLNGQSNINQSLVPTGNPADVTIGTAGFSTPVTAGTFMVDGAQVTVASTDSLQDVFNNIASATNNKVTASYNSGTDEITLASTDGSPLVLGSAADTSNFLQVAQLYSPDPSSVTSASATGLNGSSANVTTGSFTVDGAQVTVASTDSLQDIFNNIASATNNKVTAAYNSSTDSITLASTDGSPLVLGNSADTSNFLQVAQLSVPNPDSVTSASALGKVNTTVTMTDSDLATPVSDGGSGNGAFTINGVTINYDASTDSIQNVLDRINSSSAGVTAAYNTVNNRFVLTNNTTGNVGISMQDVPGSGNFLAATGLSGGALISGKNLTYTLNNSSQTLVSESNTITQASSGIQNLSVTALATGSATVTVGSDTSAVSTAIQQFITDYNSVQNYISSQQIVSTGSDGTVTPGTLTGDQTADDITTNLRSLSFIAGSGLSGAIKTLGDLGIQTNGQNNTLSLSDSSTLNSALANNLSSVQSFFSDATNGMATQLSNYITNITASDGELTNHQASLSQQSGNITTQIANLETKITSDTAQWTSEFQAMEQAQSQVNQELTYLSEQVSNGSL